LAFEHWELFRIEEDGDAAGDAGLASNEAYTFEGENHLVHRRRSDAEVALQVSLGRRSTHDLGIGVDEGQILSLLGGEAGSR
jgi:hypothetical protein